MKCCKQCNELWIKRERNTSENKRTGFRRILNCDNGCEYCRRVIIKREEEDAWKSLENIEGAKTIKET